MTQNISTQTPNNFGSINKIGSTPDGRIIYQVIDGNKKSSIKMSVAAKDADIFEKSYNDIMTAAPKLKEYAEKNSPEKIEKKQKIAKWIVAGAGIIGGAIPLLKCKINGVWDGVKAVLLTLLGTGVGLGAGIFGASRMVTPPGAKEFAKATQTISKLDIKQVG